MKIATLTAIAAFGLVTAAVARPYDDIMQEAQAAFAADDFVSAGALLDEAQVQRPYSLFLTRNRVLTRILTERMDDAIRLAQEIADRGLVLETPPNDAFDRMRAAPAFAPVASQMAANAAAKGAAVVDRVADDAGLLPEAIAAAGGGKVFIGSVRTGKILSLDKKGGSRDVAFAQGGVFDIEPRKKLVWAAVNNQLAFEHTGDAPAFASVMAFDAKSGAPRREVRVAEPTALLGDLEVARNGAIYASDSLTPRLFRMAPDGETLDIFAKDDRFANLQGLALDEKNHRLFVADYLTGLFAVDLETRKVTAIANPTGAHLGGIDGLYLYKGDLIGVQNGTSPQRIVRITLDQAGSVAESLEVLAQNLDGWNEPTHGFVSGGAFFYIATSNWPAYDDEGNVRENADLMPLRIMSISLD